MMDKEEKKVFLIVLIVCMIIITILTLAYNKRLDKIVENNKILVDIYGVEYKNIPFEYRRLD